MTQAGSQQAYKRLQDRPKTAPGGHGTSQGRPRDAKTFQTPKENHSVLPSRPFASDALLRPQDGPKMAQESPKTGPREAQDGPKSAQERPKTSPRSPQDQPNNHPNNNPNNHPLQAEAQALEALAAFLAIAARCGLPGGKRHSRPSCGPSQLDSHRPAAAFRLC